MLFKDLRIDEDKFNELNKQDIFKLAPLYHSTNLNLLAKFIKGQFNQNLTYEVKNFLLK